MKDQYLLNQKECQVSDHPSYVHLSNYSALESYLGRLNKFEFEDVLNRDGLLKGPNAHDLYLKQFN
jgi:hypothetical protein